MIYDVEFFYEGAWRFHCQEISETKAESCAAWLAKALGIPTRYTGREN